MEDTPSGLRVLFDDYQRECGSRVRRQRWGFVAEAIAAGLGPGIAHSVRIEMDFVRAPENDVVRVYVDGPWPTPARAGGLFRDCEGNETPTVDWLLFRAPRRGGPGQRRQGLPDRRRLAHVGGRSVLRGSSRS